MPLSSSIHKSRLMFRARMTSKSHVMHKKRSTREEAPMLKTCEESGQWVAQSRGRKTMSPSHLDSLLARTLQATAQRGNKARDAR